MIKRSTLKGISLTALSLSALAGGCLYYIKYRVSDLRAHLTHVHQEIVRVTEATHVLSAEWGYLNQPDRLKRLNERHQKLRPIQVLQMASLDAFVDERAAFSTTMLASIHK